MTVLIRQKIGRRTCNNRCYNAEGDKCQCICDGKNHGIGLFKATRITGELVEELIDKGLEPNFQTYFKEIIDV